MSRIDVDASTRCSVPIGHPLSPRTGSTKVRLSGWTSGRTHELGRPSRWAHSRFLRLLVALRQLDRSEHLNRSFGNEASAGSPRGGSAHDHQFAVSTST